VIEEEIRKARCAIVLWSRESASSDWVKTEAAEAQRRGILVPALIEDVEPPFAFRRIQAAKLADWLAHTGQSPDPEFDQLVAAVREVLEAPETGKQARLVETTAASEERSVLGGRDTEKPTPKSPTRSQVAYWAALFLAVVGIATIFVYQVRRPSQTSNLSDQSDVVPEGGVEDTTSPEKPEPAMVDAGDRQATEAGIVDAGKAPPTTTVPEVVRNTMAGLSDADPAQQVASVHALSNLSHPAARKALEDALRHPNDDVADRAAWALGKLANPKSVPALLKQLAVEDSSRGDVFVILWVLPKFPGPRDPYPAIRGFLASTDDSYRAAAMRALGYRKQPSDVATLVDALEDSSPTVRSEAVKALIKFADAALPQVLAETEKPHSVEGCYALATLLGRMGDGRKAKPELDPAVPFLVSQLSEDQVGKLINFRFAIAADGSLKIWRAGGGASVSWEAKDALERIGTPKALAALAAHAADEPK
jgi:hypothetical protein